MRPTVFLWLMAMLLMTPLSAFAQEQYPDAGPAQPPASSAGQGPVRMARFSFVHGDITWRGTDQDDWSPAAVNQPLQQGAQIWVSTGRAEIQFDDGSYLRIGRGAILTLQTLYSDDQGEFTEVQMSEGVATLSLRNPQSIYQIDTPLASANAAGPADVRVGIDDATEVAVRQGSATVENNTGKQTLYDGDYLYLPAIDAPLQVTGLPAPDQWDNWNARRDAQSDDGQSGQYLPANIALVSGNLGSYGAWRDDPRYGHVWCPRVAQAGWRPYEQGHWVWVNPFGWTWVSTEAWGWAPYHYGTWVSQPYGWAWVPGPARQYWCPAVVHFSEYQGGVAWAPLCPTEVRYPSVLSIGFSNGGLSLNFSIGGCAVYTPATSNYCEPRPWSNAVVNRVTYVSNTTIINQTTVIDNTVINNAGRAFVPVNARFASGVTTASAAAFGGRGAYRPLPRATVAPFVSGRSIGAPSAGSHPFSGPSFVRPTAASFTATRTFRQAPAAVNSLLTRPIVRASLPGRQPEVFRPAPSLRPTTATQPFRPQVFRPQARPGASPVRPQVPFGSASAPRPVTPRPSAPGVVPGRPEPAAAYPFGQARTEPGGQPQAAPARTPFQNADADRARSAATSARARLGFVPSQGGQGFGFRPSPAQQPSGLRPAPRPFSRPANPQFTPPRQPQTPRPAPDFGAPSPRTTQPQAPRFTPPVTARPQGPRGYAVTETSPRRAFTPNFRRAPAPAPQKPTGSPVPGR